MAKQWPESMVKPGLRGRLMGMKIVEQDERHIVFRGPLWVGEDGMKKLAERMERDSRLLDRAAGWKFTVSGRLLRVDRGCTCGDGEAEEDRGAVLRCPVHGPGAVKRDG